MTVRSRTVAMLWPLILLAVFGTLGCSSAEMTGPQPAITDTDADDAAFKIAITTDYQNPQPETHIIFELVAGGRVYIEITNATGYHVKTLYDDLMEAGTYSIYWDGTNDDGETLGSGIYLLHAATSNFDSWAAFPVRVEVDQSGDQ